MFSVRNSDDGKTPVDARIVPKGHVILQSWNRDTWIIRRDDLVRVFIEPGESTRLVESDAIKQNGGDAFGPPKHSSIAWMTRAGETFSVMLPAFFWALNANGGDAEYIASAVYDSIVYGTDDVVWFEQPPAEGRVRSTWLAVGNTDAHKRDWPELIATEPVR